MVDTSQLIKNTEDVLATSKVACLLENDEIAKIAASLPRKSILSKIYYDKTRLRPNMNRERQLLGQERCLIQRNPKLLSLLDIDAYFVSEKTQLNLVMASALMFSEERRRLWIYGKDLYSYNRVFLYSLRHKENKQRIGKVYVKATY